MDFMKTEKGIAEEAKIWREAHSIRKAVGASAGSASVDGAGASSSSAAGGTAAAVVAAKPSGWKIPGPLPSALDLENAGVFKPPAIGTRLWHEPQTGRIRARYVIAGQAATRSKPWGTSLHGAVLWCFCAHTK